MPKLKKRKSVLSVKRKYHYKVKQTIEMPNCVETYTKLEDRIEVCGLGYQPVLTGLNSSTQTDCLAMDTKNIQTELNVSSKGVQTQDIPIDDHPYSLREEGNEMENLEHHDPYLLTSFEQTTMAEKDVYMECEEVVVETSSFCKFKEELDHELREKNFLLKSTKDNVTLIEIYDHIDTPSIKLCLSINSDFSTDLFVHRKKIERTHPIWEGLPVVFDNIKSVLILLERISKFNVCTGNQEEEYQQLVPVGSGLSSNTSTEILAYREGDFQAKHQSGLKYDSTIRTVNCQLLTKRNLKCFRCTEYGYSLKRRVIRLSDRLTSGRQFNHTKFKHKDMTRHELTKKLAEQKEEIKDLHQELWKLKRIFDKEINANGMRVSDHEHVEFSNLMDSCQPHFEKDFPDTNCRQRLFWEQQLLHSKKTDKRSMRWHPMIIRWCLYIRSKSEKAYDAMRETGFINLPSKRTLFDYSHFLRSELGMQKDVFQLAKEEAEKYKLYDAPWRSHVGLLFDEIKVKEDLVYDKSTGELIGYCNLGEIGNQMLSFEKRVNSSKQNLAKYVLVVMLRSLASSFCFPLCGFATESITGDYLYPILWSTVSTIETQLGLHVLFFTCDGASSNRRFFNLHRVGQEEVVYKTVNPFGNMDQNIYFVSDVPHLVKTLRNNFCNSYSHKKTRQLWRNGKDISWFHIVRFFEEHCELNLYNPCPKLTRSHIDLVSYNYMKVNLAAQVFSDSVANALEELYGPEMSETVNFIRIVNKFFDCLNVRSLFEGRNKRNPNLNPFKSIDDNRFVFLTEEVPNYLSEWNNSVQNRNGNFSKAQRDAMMLSHQTITGIKTSVKSIDECVKHMLSMGASFVLTHSFNQDPLEQHFGHYRHKGGANSNPSVYEVRNTMTTIRTVHAQAIAPKQGNIRRENINKVDIDNTPLQKRK